MYLARLDMYLAYIRHAHEDKRPKVNCRSHGNVGDRVQMKSRTFVSFLKSQYLSELKLQKLTLLSFPVKFHECVSAVSTVY